MKSPSFNTASGKYCCNVTNPMTKEDLELLVSIPQAVSTVATLLDVNKENINEYLFQYRKR